MKDIDTWELYWLSILKMTLLTRTSVLIVGVYKGTIVNLEITGIWKYRHRSRKTDRRWSRKLLKARQRVNADQIPRSSSSQFLYAQSCSAIYDKSLAWQFIDWSTFFIHEQISSNHKISGTENIMRKQRAWRDCHPVFFVWKCCEWCVWPRATDDNILLNCSPQHFLSQQSKEE